MKNIWRPIKPARRGAWSPLNNSNNEGWGLQFQIREAEGQRCCEGIVMIDVLSYHARYFLVIFGLLHAEHASTRAVESLVKEEKKCLNMFDAHNVIGKTRLTKKSVLIVEQV